MKGIYSDFPAENYNLDVLSEGKILISCDEHIIERIRETCENPRSGYQNRICNSSINETGKKPCDLTIYDTATNKFDTFYEGSSNILFDINSKKFYQAPDIIHKWDIRKQKSILLKDGRVLFYLGLGRRNEEPPIGLICPCVNTLHNLLDEFVEIYTPPKAEGNL